MIGTTSIIVRLAPALEGRGEVTVDEVWKALGDPRRTRQACIWVGKAMRRMGWEPRRHLTGTRQAGYRRVQP
jgi:hypothetical protein